MSLVVQIPSRKLMSSLACFLPFSNQNTSANSDVGLLSSQEGSAITFLQLPLFGLVGTNFASTRPAEVYGKAIADLNQHSLSGSQGVNNG